MKKIHFFILTISLVLASCKSSHKDLGDGVFANIETNKGAIIVRLEHEKTPVTVANFVSLAEGKNTFVDEKYKGKPYYDGLIFHRIMKNFMIQGGCPDGIGTGNPGYKFMDEPHDSLLHDKKGILSMANSGPATNGSQFFITHKETPWLNGKHTVFGEVVKGIEVVDSIAAVKIGSRSKPDVDVVMNTVKIIRNGKEAKKFDAVDIMTEYFSKEGERIAALEKEKAEKAAAVLKVKQDFITALPIEKKKATELPSGLRILSLREGDGPKPKIGQKALVKYAGYLENGSLFDSNYKEVTKTYDTYDWNREQARGYEPIAMLFSPDSPLVPGFKEGLLSMKIGDKVRLFIPSHLGYGEHGSRGVIPPNADLVFDLEITGVAE